MNILYKILLLFRPDRSEEFKRIIETNSGFNKK